MLFISLEKGIIVSSSLKTASVKADLIRSLSQYVLFARLAFFFFLKNRNAFPPPHFSFGPYRGN